jgi:hypothetical protein
LHASKYADFDSARLRPLRCALIPVHQLLQRREAKVLEYGRARQLRKEEEGRRARQAELDKRHRDTTQLRSGRIERLRQLCEAGGGGRGDARLIEMADGSTPATGGAGGPEGSGAIRYLCQVPDGAVYEPSDLAPLTAASSCAVSSGSITASTLPMSNSGGGGGTSSSAGDALTEPSPPATPELFTSRQCYACKARFSRLHHFYAQLCPPCAALNYRMRHATADLTGRVALLTGARVKIGFEIGLKLLRAGATLIATSRFPADTARRYAAAPDFGVWKHRLHLHALDLRDLGALEHFCAFLTATLPRLDIVVNNACQTVRRPASYYAHLLPAETALEEQLLQLSRSAVPSISAARKSESGGEDGGSSCGGDDATRGGADGSGDGDAGSDAEGAVLLPLLAQHDARIRAACEAAHRPAVIGHQGVGGGATALSGATRLDARRLPPSPARLSQLVLTPEDARPLIAILAPDTMATEQTVTGDGVGDHGGGALAAPAPTASAVACLDVNGQQIDLRSTNSWVLKLADVSTPELAEVLAINTLAPFVINARLQPLLEAAACTPPPESTSEAGAAFVVNVSAMEGKFYRYKTPNHPHTNMAKAALNMMTRTSAPDLAASHRIFMTAVDTGWINDENPRERAARTAESHHFQTPIDEVDAAARVLHPVFDGVLTGAPLFGVFLKDYKETEW